jgi:hypothetical protein
MKALTLTAIIALLALSANAKIWRVNNTPGINADFSDLQVAIYSAEDGDTLYVEGVEFRTKSGNIFVNKKLSIIGAGYFLEGKQSAKILSSLFIIPKATGTVIHGLDLVSINVAADNVDISRNNIGKVSIGSYHDSLSGSSITVAVSDLNISHNIFNRDNGNGIQSWFNGLSNTTISNNIMDYMWACIDLNGDMNNVIIANNTILGVKSTLSSYESGKSIVANNAIIQNNYCTGDIYMGYELDNNKYYSANNSASNNISDPSLRNYLAKGINDNYYQLSVHSPAKNAGYDGTDLGAFGGSNPYVLSGLPPIPVIYEMSAPVSGSAATGLPVKIKVKTQN